MKQTTYTRQNRQRAFWVSPSSIMEPTTAFPLELNGRVNTGYMPYKSVHFFVTLSEIAYERKNSSNFNKFTWLSHISKAFVKPNFLIHKRQWNHMMTSSNGNIFRVTGHLCGEFTGPRLIVYTCTVSMWLITMCFLEIKYITMTSQWARWRLKSPASRLFTQPFIQTQIKENIKAPRRWSLFGEFTGDRWIPRANGQ